MLLKLCFLHVNIDTPRLTLIFPPPCLLFSWGWREQLSRAEEKMNGLDGCYCERTCSVKGVVYREDEGWTDGCRNCTCTVGFTVWVCACDMCAHMGLHV